MSEKVNCKWVLNDDGFWVSECDHDVVMDTDPLEGDFKYCPYCGRKIKCQKK